MSRLSPAVGRPVAASQVWERLARMPVSTAEELLAAPAARRAALVAEALARGWGRVEARRAAKGCFAAKQPGADVLEHLRAAAALLEREGADGVPNDVHAAVRGLVRRISRALRRPT